MITLPSLSTMMLVIIYVILSYIVPIGIVILFFYMIYAIIRTIFFEEYDTYIDENGFIRDMNGNIINEEEEIKE